MYSGLFNDAASSTEGTDTASNEITNSKQVRTLNKAADVTVQR